MSKKTPIKCISIALACLQLQTMHKFKPSHLGDLGIEISPNISTFSFLLFLTRKTFILSFGLLSNMDVLAAIRSYVTKAVKLAQGMKVLLLDDETVRG
jgi:hypothetical protein